MWQACNVFQMMNFRLIFSVTVFCLIYLPDVVVGCQANSAVAVKPVAVQPVAVDPAGAVAALVPAPATTTDDDDIAQQILDKIPKNFASIGGDGATQAFINQALAQTFGGNMKVGSFQGASQGVITCPVDLDCKEFDRTCRWMNSGEADTVFYQANGAADPAKWEYIMGVSEQPVNPYLLAANREGAQHSAVLISDDIPSQPGDGKVILSHYLTPLLQIKACARARGSSEFITCSPESSSFDNPGPRELKLKGPIDGPFEIVLILTNFITDPGAIGMIDNLRYESGLCSDETSTTSTTTTTTKSTTTRRTTPRTTTADTVNDGVGSMCDALDCDFSSGDSCNFNLQKRNEPGFEIQWGRYGNRLTGIHRDYSGSSNFKKPYLVAKGSSGSFNQQFIMESPEFINNSPGRQLKFWKHQASNSIVSKVCFNTLSNCPKVFTDVRRVWNQESIDIPQSTRPQKMFVVAEKIEPTGVLGIDELRVFDRSTNSFC